MGILAIKFLSQLFFNVTKALLSYTGARVLPIILAFSSAKAHREPLINTLNNHQEQV
jgi:hypothetical protein